MSTLARAIIQSIIFAALTATGLFCAAILMSYSWVKILAVIAILAPGTVWLVAHGVIRKIFKYIVIAMLIFAITFASFESYVFWNAGNPSTNGAPSSGITIGYPNVLNTSLTKLVQGIESSTTFALLTAEHGKTEPETIWVNTGTPGGSITVDFYGQGSNVYYDFSASAGDQYHVSVSSYSGQPFPQSYILSSSSQAFKQIDTRGLQWFYNQALELAQNKTGTTPQVDALSMTITFEDQIYVSYIGITITIVGTFNGQSTLIADFEPSGTLIYMSQPQ